METNLCPSLNDLRMAKAYYTFLSRFAVMVELVCPLDGQADSMETEEPMIVTSLCA